jgi:hypothetical protein
MSTLDVKFAKLGTDHAPGQEVRQGDAVTGAGWLGDPPPGVAVDFSHGDVNDTAFPPAPGALEAFIQPPDAPRKRASNAVARPASVIKGELRALSVPLIDMRKTPSPDPLDCVAIAPLGLVVTSRRSLQESSVIRLGIHVQPSIDAWFNVVLCAPEGQRFRIELVAFAPSSELRERMAQLWSEARPIADRLSVPV